MNMKLRVATWNLDRSGIRKKYRIQPQLDKLLAIHADILILTETHESVRPEGYDYCIQGDPDPAYHKEGESYVTIWSRFPITEISTAPGNRYFTVCGIVQELKIIVYGTIITYGADGVSEGAAYWEKHWAAVKTQVEEWISLGLDYPDHLRIVAGDFNENLNGKRWYGVKDAKEAIRNGLELADMHCPTGGEEIALMAGTGNLSRCTVDHICVSRSNTKIADVKAWEGFDQEMILSDHNGLLVDIQLGNS